jgi:tetratricopeptide (TPR) repeat protein
MKSTSGPFPSGTVLSSALALLFLVGAPAMRAGQSPTTGNTNPAANSAKAQSSAPASAAENKPSASTNETGDIYYHFMLGHYYESLYESEGRAEDADQSIDEYKKVLAMDPGSIPVTQRLAEIYAKSQHSEQAVVEANIILKQDPENLAAHRLLARLYVRKLSEAEGGAGQKEALAKATEQFEKILQIDPTNMDAALWLARLYRFDNRISAAEGVLRDVLKKDPDNEQALEQLSQLYMDQGRSAEAVALLEKAADDISSPDLLNTLGKAYVQTHDYAKAEAAYRRAVEAEPDDTNSRRGLAQTLLTEGKLPEALQQYQQLTAMEPDSPENYLRMAQICRRLDRLEDAEKYLLQAKERAPGSLEILYNEALLYETQGRFDDAAKILSDSIARVKARPSESDSDALAILYELLGGIYRDKGDTADAVRSYEELGNLSPLQTKRARTLVIEAYRSGRQTDQAMAEVRKDMAADPSERSYQFTYAMLLCDQGQTAQAVKYLQGMLHGNADDLDVYLNLAQVQQRAREYADAEQSALQAEKLAHSDDDRASAWFLLGAIYEREKKFDLAEAEFKKALDQDPHNGEALNYYGYMLADRGIRLDEAVSMIQRALQEDPANGAFLDSLGWAYYKQGKLIEAQKYLEQASNRSTHDPTILEHLGDVYDKSGQTERAAQAWDRAQAEWEHVLPADYEADKVAQLDQKISAVKKRLAQKSPDSTHPQ